jgi:hypothetical protein
VRFVLADFQASAAPRPENLGEKGALFFGLDTQITIIFQLMQNQTKIIFSF